MSSQPFLLRFVLSLAGCLALAVTGCKSGSSLVLSASTAAVDPDGGSDGGVDAGLSADAGGIALCGQLLIDRVRVVVRRIDLERAPAAADAGTDGGQADGGLALCECPDGGTVCETNDDVHVGPFLVDLAGDALSGGIHQVFDVAIPEGTYEDVRFAINTLSRHQAADGGLGEMKDLHSSIASNGSVSGTPFQFTTSMHMQQKQEGPFTVGAGTSNIVLSVDPSGWFVGEHGQVLDPLDPENRGRILANIRCSVRMSSVEGMHDGGSLRRDFEDDEDEDQCRASDDDNEGEHGDFLRLKGGHGHGDDGDDDGDHGHHHRACMSTPLNCGGGGAPDGGAPDGGMDAGLDGG